VTLEVGSCGWGFYQSCFIPFTGLLLTADGGYFALGSFYFWPKLDNARIETEIDLLWAELTGISLEPKTDAFLDFFIVSCSGILDVGR
jgi:hypothetical protein